ncbi:MAG: twin-arginine translocase TatA/TatE family subunit [Candidatus Limnocylindrales bacterium]
MSDIGLLLLVILIALLLFRGNKVLPALGAALGRGVKEIRHSVDRDPVKPDDAEPSTTSSE